MTLNCRYYRSDRAGIRPTAGFCNCRDQCKALIDHKWSQHFSHNPLTKSIFSWVASHLETYDLFVSMQTPDLFGTGDRFTWGNFKRAKIKSDFPLIPENSTQYTCEEFAKMMVKTGEEKMKQNLFNYNDFVKKMKPELGKCYFHSSGKNSQVFLWQNILSSTP